MLRSKYMPSLRTLVALMICASTLALAADMKQQIRSIRDLGKLGSESIPKLVPYLSDPNQEIRVEAVKAIAGIGTARSLDPLVQATGDNDAEVQMRATDGLVNFYSPGYLKPGGFTASVKRVGTTVKSKFTDTDDLVIEPYIQVRPDVISAVGKLASGGSSMESRANAARAVGILRGRAAVDDLIKALHSKDDQVLHESLVALQKIKDESAGPRILFLLRDLNENVQIPAIETVGLLRTKEAIPDLRDVLNHARSNKVRRAALSALAMLPDEQSRPLFSQYLSD